MENEWIMTVAFYVDAMVFARGLVFRGSEYSFQSAYVCSEVRYMERVIKEHRGWNFSEFPSLGRAYNGTIPAGTWTNVAAMEIHHYRIQQKKTQFKHFECCIAMLEYRRVAHDEQCSKSKLSLLTVALWIIQVGSRTLCIKWKHNQGFDHCVGALCDAWHCLLWQYQFWSLLTWLLL